VSEGKILKFPTKETDKERINREAREWVTRLHGSGATTRISPAAPPSERSCQNCIHCRFESYHQNSMLFWQCVRTARLCWDEMRGGACGPDLLLWHPRPPKRQGFMRRLFNVLFR
jgi:hypothetical protein